MQPFATLTAIAAPLALDNVDTDQIIPGQFLKTVGRAGLGAALFHSMRYNSDGREAPDFVLNRDPYRQARILVALDNFGCGSSREHAPWALWDFGIRAIVAVSFADIFYNNCTKNGLLPVQLPRSVVEFLLSEISSSEPCYLTIDLAHCTVSSSRFIHGFCIDDAIRQRLLQGLDEIGQSLQRLRAIEVFEEQRASRAHLCPQIVNPTEMLQSAPVRS